MTERKGADAWAEFWAHQGGEGGGGCMPDRWEPLDRALANTWSGFASRLEKKARVLDLASGDGRVLSYLVASRGDLDLLGVDRAERIPSAPASYRLRGGISMESLPFEDGRFSVVTSQYGFEYGDVEAIAGEIGRVLRGNGQVALLLHRADGPILEHNLARRDAIRWVIEDQDLFAKAHGSLRLRAIGGPPVPPLLAQAPAEGARRFGSSSPAWEIPEAIRQSLELGARDLPANVTRLLHQIEARARNELGRIASLEGACAIAADESRVERAFDAAGLRPESYAPVNGPEGRAIGDFRIFVPL